MVVSTEWKTMCQPLAQWLMYSQLPEMLVSILSPFANLLPVTSLNIQAESHYEKAQIQAPNYQMQTGSSKNVEGRCLEDKDIFRVQMNSER